MILIYSLLIGLLGSAALAFFAYIAKLLTPSGCLALVLIGTLTFLWGPPIFWLLLVIFFGSSALINKRKPIGSNPVVAKGATRDGWQLLANSLPYLICLTFYSRTNELHWSVAAASAIAGAVSDTWSSEIGSFSKKPPRNILTFKQEPTGLSGAVSILGTIGGISGSALIAACYAVGMILFRPDLSLPQLLLVPFFAGIATTLVDSLLGATLQVKYLCTVCGQLTEQKSHHGHLAYQVAGLTFMNNDLVNLLSGVAAVIVAWLLQLVIT